MTLISMMVGSALVPVDESADSNYDDEDLPPEPDHAPDAMIDGGLLAYALDIPEEPVFEDERPEIAQEIAPETPDQPADLPEDNNRLPYSPKSTANGSGNGIGIVEETSGTVTDPADLTGKELIKSLRDDLKATKGDLDKESLKSLRDELKSLKGSAKDNVLTADDTGNFIEGLEGNDRLVGGKGSDLLEGGDDNDSLRATEGGDVMIGGGGSDILIGVESSYDPALGLHQFIHGKSGDSEDILDGGDGDDVLRMGRGDIGIGGAGADLFFVQGDMDDPQDDIVPVIEDYNHGEDTLIIAIPFTEAELIESWPDMPDRNYEIETVDFDDGTGATVLVNGVVMAHVTGAQGLTPDDIRIVGNEMVGANAFDISHGIQKNDTWWGGIEEDAAAQRLLSGS